MGFTCALRVTTQAVVSYTALPPLRKRGQRSGDLPLDVHTHKVRLTSLWMSTRYLAHKVRSRLCGCPHRYLVRKAHSIRGIRRVLRLPYIRLAAGKPARVSCTKSAPMWTHCLRGTFLLHCPGSRLHQTLSGILPCEARTFLSCGLSAPAAATICPTQNIWKFSRFQRKLQVSSSAFCGMKIKQAACPPCRLNNRTVVIH